MTAVAFHLLAFASTCAGAVCLYLGAPRQQWLSRPWPAPASRAGGGFLLAGWLLWCGALHPASAFFTALTVCMVLFILLPILAALAAPSRRP